MAQCKNSLGNDDHDLLIRIDTRQQDMAKAVDDLKDGLSAKLAVLEKTKLDKEEYTRNENSFEKEREDHEKRIRRIEKYVWIVAGGAYALQAFTWIYQIYLKP